MIDETMVKRLLYFDERGGMEWRKDDHGGFEAEVNGVLVNIRQESRDRTHDWVVLTLSDRIGAPGSLPEPIEKEKAPLRNDMRKLLASAEKKASGYEELWEKLSRKVCGYDKL